MKLPECHDTVGKSNPPQTLHGTQRFKYHTGTSRRVRIAVAGGKGGCGKTTTALALADALVDARRQPVVVDCDRDMPNLHVYAGTRDEPGVDDIAAGHSLEAVAHDTPAHEGVRVIPGLTGGNVEAALVRLERRDSTPPKSSTTRPTSSTRSTPPTPPLILDTPAGANEDVAVPLRFADRTVLVTTPSEPCLRAAVKTASMARALEARVSGVVVSRAERVPPDLPGVLGVPRKRMVAVPPSDEPLAPGQQRPVRALCGRFGPNA